MKFLLSALVVAILVLSVFSCSDSVVNDDDDAQPIAPYDTLVFNDPDDVPITPDFKSMTFYVYDSTIGMAVELWEPHDSTNYPADYMFFVYLYGTNRDMMFFGLHDFRISRDHCGDGHFEDLLAEGVITWSNSRTPCVRFNKSIMPDFETKDVWAYSMVNGERMPDSGRFCIADSLSQD